KFTKFVHDLVKSCYRRLPFGLGCSGGEGLIIVVGRVFIVVALEPLDICVIVKGEMLERLPNAVYARVGLPQGLIGTGPIDHVPNGRAPAILVIATGEFSEQVVLEHARILAPVPRSPALVDLPAVDDLVVFENVVM